ncbi:MAG: HupE/UreJ family protein [Mangrovicoccus sp.]|nr:HupE/UreJ family protein [Mangrovicoccus sp.]
MIRLCFALLLMVLALWPAGGARAHALEPGYLEIEAVKATAAAQTWRVTWRKPQVNAAPMAIEAVLPDICTPRRPPAPRFDGRAFISGWQASCAGPITDGVVRIEGLERMATDVLLRFVAEPGGRPQTLRLTPSEPATNLPETPSPWGVFTSYAQLGLEHILEGLDHLLFVFALLLLIPDLRRLFWAITSFTLAHSITLTAATLGWLHLPVAPVEAVIALSIVFLASEIVQRRDGAPRLSEAAPWLVSFAFGLLHGLGFASALDEIGLPQGEIPLALFAFNIGVEAGQLLFIAMVLATGWILSRLLPGLLSGQRRPGAPGITCAAYAIGSIAAFWMIERVLGFVV